MAARFINTVEARRLVTYVVVGGAVSALYAGLVIGFVEFVDVSPIAASLGSFVIALPASYWAHSSITFRDRPKTGETPARFVAVTVSAFLCATFAMYVIHDVLKLHYGFGIVAIWILVPIANYTIHLAWTFRTRDAHGRRATEKAP